MSESGEEREELLDKIVERWEALREAGNELNIEALCDGDEALAAAINSQPGVMEEAEEEIAKLQRFDRSFGDIVRNSDVLTEDAAIAALGDLDSQSTPSAELDRAARLDQEQANQDPNRDEADRVEANRNHSDDSFPGSAPVHPDQDDIRDDVTEPIKSWDAASPHPLPQSTNEEQADSANDSPMNLHRVHPGTRLIKDSRITIESRIDGGGLGDIYRASDESLRRAVAVKLIRNYAQNRHYKRRFIREAVVTAQLNGPGVIPIHGYGIAADGQPFYVMRLIDGDGLDEKIKRFHALASDKVDLRRRNSVEFQRLLRYLLSVCQTVSYAHDLGVVHCDLKPQNIKIGKYDEVFVLDWGEATSCGSRLDVPRHHSGRLSPAYAPPELASASSPPSPATDIYSLGVILYELLIGRRAVDDSPSERTAKLRSRHVPQALASICSKCMETQRRSRYESVNEMAEDIERWLADESVTVHRYSLGERVAQSMRRYTTMTQIAAGLITALLILSAVLGMRLKFQFDQQRQRNVQTLKVSAGLSADSIAGELDRRILFLESLSDALVQETSLMQSLQESRIPTSAGAEDDGADEDPSSAQEGSADALTDSDDPLAFPKALTTWLDTKLLDRNSPEASSWFILDSKGRQVAKNSGTAADRAEALKSLGKLFRYRDYFHGEGVDFEKANQEELDVEPISEPYLCKRYTSSTTKELRVALTVPIKNETGQVVGVIGMSFNLDELSFVSNRLAEEESLILVDTRPAADGEENGVIVVHPGYRAQVLDGYEYQHQRVVPALVSEMKSVATRRIVQMDHRENHQRLAPIDNYEADFVDPVLKTQGTGVAFEPVIVPHRGSFIDTGLVVIIRGQGS